MTDHVILRTTYCALANRLLAESAEALAQLAVPAVEAVEPLRAAMMHWRLPESGDPPAGSATGLVLPDIASFDFMSVTELVDGAASGALSEDEYMDLHRALVGDYYTDKANIIRMNEIRLVNEFVRYLDRRHSPLVVALRLLGQRYPSRGSVNDPDILAAIDRASEYLALLRRYGDQCEAAMFDAWNAIDDPVLKIDARATLELIGIVDSDDRFVGYRPADSPHLAQT